MRNAPISAAVVVILLMSAAASLSAAQSLTLEPVTSLHHPVNVSFTSNGIMVSYRPNDSATELARLYANGTVRPYASSFSGVQEVYLAETNGGGGFISGDLFLCSGDSIYRISGGSGIAALFATPLSGSTVEYISFDYSGSWGHLLYALTGDGSVWAVNATGTAVLVTNLGNNLMPEGLAVAPIGFGEFSGDLLVTMEKSHNLVAIPRNATSTHIILAVFPNQAPERVLDVIPNRDLFVAKYDQDTIVRVPAQNFAEHVAMVLVITEGESGQAGSINVLEASGANITVNNLLTDSTSPHFEGAEFIPAGYLHISNEVKTSTAVDLEPNLSAYSLYLVTAGALIGVAVSVSLVIFYLRKNR